MKTATIKMKDFFKFDFSTHTLQLLPIINLIENDEILDDETMLEEAYEIRNEEKSLINSKEKMKI